MRNYALFFICMATCLTGYGQSRRDDSSGADTKRLTCLVLGYDSVVCYSGTSRQMQDINKGKITDTAFVNAMFWKIESGGLSMVIKPGGGGDMLSNFQEMIDLANNHGIYRRSVDSGDANEDKAFGFVTPPIVTAALRGEKLPSLKLDLPRDEPDSPSVII